MMKTLELWDDQDFTAIIILKPECQYPTWTNQVGGTACIHPEAEGIFVNLPGYRFDNQKNPWLDFVGSLDDPYDPEYVQEFLDFSGCCNFAEPLTPEEFQSLPNVSRYCHEAWVPVKVKIDQNGSPISLRNFDGCIGIITHENSD